MNTTSLCLRSLALLVGCVLAVPAGAQCTTIGSAAYWEVTWPGCVTPSVLIASANPVLGTTISLRTSNLPASTLVVATLFLLPPTLVTTPTTNLASYPLLGGCYNYLPNFDGVVLAVLPMGVADVYLSMPANAWWLGKVVHCQSAVLSWTVDIEMSNAVCLHLGT